MRITTTLLALVAGLAPLAGCMLPDDPELEGIALDGGNAVAHNSALQIIDPWPPGVQDNDLVVPADRGGDEADGGDAVAEPAI